MNIFDQQHMNSHIQDVKRLVTIAADRGRKLTNKQAYKAWVNHSEDYCSGWEGLGEDDETLYRYLEGKLGQQNVGT